MLNRCLSSLLFLLIINVLRVNVKGEGKDCKLAECAMCVGACPFGHVCARGKARGRGGEATECRLFPKRSVVWAKNRESSKESPLVLGRYSLFFDCVENFLLKNCVYSK